MVWKNYNDCTIILCTVIKITMTVYMHQCYCTEEPCEERGVAVGGA